MHPDEHRDSSQVLSVCRIPTAELVQEPACRKLKLSDDQAALPHARLAVAKRFGSHLVGHNSAAHFRQLMHTTRRNTRSLSSGRAERGPGGYCALRATGWP